FRFRHRPQSVVPAPLEVIGHQPILGVDQQELPLRHVCLVPSALNTVPVESREFLVLPAQLLVDCQGHLDGLVRQGLHGQPAHGPPCPPTPRPAPSACPPTPPPPPPCPPVDSSPSAPPAPAGTGSAGSCAGRSARRPAAPATGRGLPVPPSPLPEPGRPRCSAA